MASALSALTSLSRRRVEYWQEAQRGQMQPKKIEPRMTRMTRMKKGGEICAVRGQERLGEMSASIVTQIVNLPYPPRRPGPEDSSRG